MRRDVALQQSLAEIFCKIGPLTDNLPCAECSYHRNQSGICKSQSGSNGPKIYRKYQNIPQKGCKKPNFRCFCQLYQRFHAISSQVLKSAARAKISYCKTCDQWFHSSLYFRHIGAHSTFVDPGDNIGRRNRLVFER